MAEPVFVDTWGWLTLRDRRERFHEKVADFLKSASHGSAFSLLTSDYVLDETFTLCFKRLSPAQATESIHLIERMASTGVLSIERISESRFEATIALRYKLQDKPDISFTDLSTMVVMEELKIGSILSADAHFTHVGKGFTLLPG